MLYFRLLASHAECAGLDVAVWLAQRATKRAQKRLWAAPFERHAALWDVVERAGVREFLIGHRRHRAGIHRLDIRDMLDARARRGA